MIGPQGQSLVFLLGVPRSGTTLFSHLLDQHPQIASPAEPWLMLAVDSIGEVHPLHAANGAVLGQAYENFTGELNVPRAKRAFARELYNQALERDKKKIFVDKTPRYYQLTDHLVEIFPSSKFLHLKRNPFAVAASLKATWNFDLVAAIEEKQSPFLFDLVLGYRYLERFSETHHRQVHTCSYEALVLNPHKIMKDALLFLGCRAGPVPKKIRRLDVHNKAMGDKNILNTKSIHKNGLSSWERILSREEKQIVHDIFSAEGLAAIGYGDLLPKLREAGIEDRGIQRADELFTEIQGRYRSQRQLVQSTARTQVGSDLRIAAARVAFAKPDSVLKLGSIERDLEEARAQLARRTEEISLLSQNKDELTEAVARQTSEVERMDSVVTALKNNLTELERQNEIHRIEAVSLREERDRLGTELSSVRHRLAQQAYETALISRERDELTETVERQKEVHRTEAVSLREERDRLKRDEEPNVVVQGMTQLVNERDQLNETVSRQAHEIHRLDLVIARLRGNVAEVKQHKDIGAEREKQAAPVSHDTNFAPPLHASIDQLARLERAIADIKRSPFWRLRNRTDRLLRTFHVRRRQMAEWERSDSRLYALNDQIGHLERAIADMKRSPFWTLRNRVDRLLRILHLRHRQMAEWERSDSKR